MKNFFRFVEFIPKSFICFREGYKKGILLNDLFAGISVGVIALPLALAFAISSGVSPEKGLFTAIVAGFIVSLFGGSRVQIGGPTGAFVVIVYAVMQKHGYDGLALATLLAAVFLLAMGFFRFGALLKYIPYPVTVGFTSGIAVVIFSSQIKDFFGLGIAKVPPEFIDKWKMYFEYAPTGNLWAISIAAATLLLIVILRKFYPKLPGAIIAVVFAASLAYFLQLPVETIESKFGGIPRILPTPTFPSFSFEMIRKVLPDAIVIALLGAIESLLSAVVADGMMGSRHKSNCELVAQGLANIGSVIFGGIPATGAIARTSANIKMGAKTPLAGMIHAVTLLLLMLFLAPFAAKIPLAALAAVLVFVAWNMSEVHHFIDIIKTHKGDSIVLVITFLMTVFVDLSMAVLSGVFLAIIIFLKKVIDKTTIETCNLETITLRLRKEIPSDVAIFEVKGPFFYGVTDLLDKAFINITPQPRVFILSICNTPFIDTTAMRALKQFGHKCKQNGVLFLISDTTEEHLDLFKKSKIDQVIGKEHIFDDIKNALEFAKKP
jgi:SulP family sulfate permease